jgi:hypothetical protein
MVKGLILAAALIAVAGCTTTKGSFCAISSPLRPSAAAVDAMTDAQVKDLLALNRKGQKLCGWRP